MVPVIALTSLENGEISYEIGPDRTLVLPRRERPASLTFRLEAHRGPEPIGVSVGTEAAGALASVESARPADLLARWQRAEVGLEPALAAGVRARCARRA